MRRFKFNLESVLTLREHTLEDERIRLAKIIHSYNLKKEELNDLLFQLNDLKNNSNSYFQQIGYNPALIANYGCYVSKIESKYLTEKELLKKLQNQVEKQQENAKKAYVELKSLENLKQKQKEEYNKQVILEEIKVLDDIVNSKRTA